MFWNPLRKGVCVCVHSEKDCVRVCVDRPAGKQTWKWSICAVLNVLLDLRGHVRGIQIIIINKKVFI